MPKMKLKNYELSKTERVSIKMYTWISTKNMQNLKMIIIHMFTKYIFTHWTDSIYIYI